MLSILSLCLALEATLVCASPQALRGADALSGSKSLLFVTKDHVDATAAVLNLTLKSDWRTMLRAAPLYATPNDDLSPVLLRSLHSAAVPQGTTFALAFHTTTPSSFTTAQFQEGTWALSDLLVATGATSIHCAASPLAASPLVQLTLLHKAASDDVSSLVAARTNLFDEHAKLASSMHKSITNKGRYHEFLARVLGDGSNLKGSPIIVDTATTPLIVDTVCAAGQAFVVESAVLTNERLTAVLRPATSPVDIYSSIDSEFGLGDDPNCVPTTSPNSNNPCSVSGAFPGMSLNYNSGSGGATQAITLNTGVSCPDCWATFSSTYTGSFQMCMNPAELVFSIGVRVSLFAHTAHAPD